MPYTSAIPSARIEASQLKNTCKIAPPVGTVVTATYRTGIEYFGGLSWLGRVIAVNDPLAWTDTLAFHGKPSQDAVNSHIARCNAMGLDLSNKTAVLWEFGKVYWEPFDSLIVLD